MLGLLGGLPLKLLLIAAVAGGIWFHGWNTRGQFDQRKQLLAVIEQHKASIKLNRELAAADKKLLDAERKRANAADAKITELNGVLNNEDDTSFKLSDDAYRMLRSVLGQAVVEHKRSAE